MAVNLERMIPILKEFVDPDNTLNLPEDAYKGLMLQGLQESNYYKNNIVNSTETKSYNGSILNMVDYYNNISGLISNSNFNCN